MRERGDNSTKSLAGNYYVSLIRISDFVFIHHGLSAPLVHTSRQQTACTQLDTNYSNPLRGLFLSFHSHATPYPLPATRISKPLGYLQQLTLCRPYTWVEGL
jgi:hypothetical protein